MRGKMGKEKIFENKVKKFLEEKGCWVVKFWGTMMTKSGTPDLLGVCNGRFLGLEIKSETGKPSALQLHNIKKIQECGGYARVLYPKDFDDFKQDIEKIMEE